MGRRRELNHVAGALLGSFVSRNNDVNGYWALGQLRRLADRTGVPEFRFNLLSGEAQPSDPLTVRVAKTYAEELARHVANRDLPMDRVRDAEIVVRFGAAAGQEAPYFTYGQPFQCTVSIVDDHGKAHARGAIGRCAPHDPKRERQRARAQRPLP